jgi:hypothetical protein
MDALVALLIINILGICCEEGNSAMQLCSVVSFEVSYLMALQQYLQDMITEFILRAIFYGCKDFTRSVFYA